MAAFESSQIFPGTVADLSPVARDVMQYFESQGYQVSGQQTATGGWLISLHKGGGFKQIMGLQTALNIKIEPTSAGTLATAGIGIFGQQAVPTMLTLLIAWPVLIPQIWGLVQQSNLDEEALTSVQQSLVAHSGATPAGGGAAEPTSAAAAAGGAAAAPPVTGAATAAATGSELKFCMNCGAGLPLAARFCSECGNQAVS
jgi:ribosomal protein L40E